MISADSRRENAILAAFALVLGVAVAAAYAGYRAATLDGSGRAGEFAGVMLWPGLLIAAAVAAVVWFGWKLNID